MFYENCEIHGVEQILPGNNGGIVTRRVPEKAYNALETDDARRMCRISTGVELRFVMESETVHIKIKADSGKGGYQIFRGSIQGAWFDSGYFNDSITDIEIKKSEEIDILKRITTEFNHPFSPEVIRVIIHTSEFEIIDISGEIRPPQKDEVPQKTLFAYGSSITHEIGGGAEQGWLAQVGYNLQMDTRNLGIAGHCRMEKEIVDYIADEGKKGNWDMAIISMGVNVLGWEKEKIVQKVTYTIDKIAKENADKLIFAVSPIYCWDDYNVGKQSALWRDQIENIVKYCNYPNVTYINGLDLIGNMSFISADQVHPSIYGIKKIAENMTRYITKRVEEK